MNLEEFEAAVAELRIDIPSELVKVAFDYIDSNGDGSLLIEELMDYMRNERWWRTSSPLSSPRSESSSPPMGSAERAAMYGTVTIAHRLHGPDRAQAIAEAAQAAAQFAGRRANLKPGPNGKGKGKGQGKDSGKDGPGGVQICYGYNDGNCNARTCPQKCAKTGKPRLHICQKCRKPHAPPRGDQCRGG